MLTRLYIDNFRALVNSELALAPRTLLMGRNGTGKSTFGDVLMRIQTLLIGQSKTDDFFGPETLTRWQHIPRQRFELDVNGPAGSYEYKLIIEHRNTAGSDEPRTRIIAETLTLDTKPLFRFEDGLVHLFNDDHNAGPEYPFDWGRSALGTIAPRHDNQKLTWFGQWLRGMTIVKPNPQQMASLVERDDFLLFADASNFAAWYHAASAADKRRDQLLHDELTEVLPGFEALNFEYAGPGRWFLRADFSGVGGKLQLYFNELSDGQRALIVLYSVVHFLLGQGRTVFLDEPDNFVSLDEIQPWLLSVTDMVDDGSGQLVLVSHHPEIFDQWAISHGLMTERDGCGPVRIRKYTQASDTALTPAESVARGWTGDQDGGTSAVVRR
jgi:energy-coupling factor transporter ATP-binding protein EcfA2